jgi:hypothetical protein
MALHNDAKLKRVLDGWFPQTVATSAWLNGLGISRQLVRHYATNHWIEPLGSGAFKRPREKVEWFGAVHSLQTQLKLPVHVGALTAISAHGFSHYLRMGQEPVYLFSPSSTRLPTWFSEQDWHEPIHYIKSNMLPQDAGLTTVSYGNIELIASTAERAILECLNLSPTKMDMVECYEIVQGMMNLRPKLMQELLEACKSIKTKRLFLYMADKAALPITRHLNPERVNLGTGDRSLAAQGVYNAKYRLTVPPELANHD